MSEPAAFRALFPVTEHLCYLNHAGVAPISTRVACARRQATDECLAWGAFRYPRLLAGIEGARASAARLLGAAPAEVAFIKNTSEGVSHVALGYPWREGDAVVVPEGEFPANVYPWLSLERRGVRVLRVPAREGRLSLDDFRAALDQPGVRVLAVSSVEFETGFRNDLPALGQLCRERGIFFFVDAIQSLGCLPLEPEACGIHALAADAHKWLLGPEGIGVFYLAREVWDRLVPAEVGWNAVSAPLEFSRINFALRPDARKFECGSQETILVHGLGAALDLILEAGIGTIGRRVLETADLLAEGLSARGYRVLSSRQPAERSGIVAFAPRHGPAAVVERLASARVFAAARGRGVRVSPHFYNDRDDAARFFEALEDADS
ncbi:MAG: aminotransferase class V-fold PLP-dependent enzyme [Thermodesulfobacteriota bacterium]